MNLEDVISYGAIIWASDPWGSCVTWNGSATFNWWNFDRLNQKWVNDDVMTHYGVKDVYEARKHAAEWAAADAESVDA